MIARFALCGLFVATICAADVYDMPLPGYEADLLKEMVEHDPDFGGDELIRFNRTVVYTRAEGTKPVPATELTGRLYDALVERGFKPWSDRERLDNQIHHGWKPVQADGLYCWMHCELHWPISPSGDQVAVAIEMERKIERDAAKARGAAADAVDEREMAISHPAQHDIAPVREGRIVVTAQYHAGLREDPKPQLEAWAKAFGK